MRLILALFILAALAACAPKLSDVTSVDTSYTLCVNGCRAFSISLGRDGSYVIDGDSDVSVRGRTKSVVADAFKNLPLADLARCPRVRAVTNMDNVTIAVHLSGNRVLYCTETASASNDDGRAAADRIRVFATVDAFGVYNAALRKRQAALISALREDTIRSVELDRTACFGNCPAYHVRFRRAGLSELYVAGSRCGVRSASVPFEHVRVALLEGGAAYVAPTYPRMWVDTPGASLLISTPKATIRSNGPDAMSWGPEFSSTVARLDQVVLDTPWTPPLPPRSRLSTRAIRVIGCS